MFYLIFFFKIIQSIFDTAAGSCAKGGTTDKLSLFCGSGSLCNYIKINFVTQLPNALVMTRSTTGRNALSVGDNSYDPEIEFENLTKTVSANLKLVFWFNFCFCN
jgi:hypothetical protein